MPQGKGTYGSKRGRPPKAKMMGYASGGMKATSAKGKKAAMVDEKKGKPKAKPAVLIAMNKGGLYANINARKKAGTSRSKSKSTISPKAYSNMKKGFPKK